MKTWRLLLICLLAAWVPARAQETKARASLDLKGEAWVGQRITLVVELLAPGYFTSAASFQLPDPPGMVLIPPTGSPVVGSETVDDVSYTVQRHELSVFASRGGPHTIPPLTVRFRFKRQPLDKETIAATVKTEPLPFVAKVPPGAEKLGAVISARNLTAVETWKPELGKAKAGDAFTRTITFTAPDVPAMAFPPFPAGKIDGVGIYPKPPEVLDHSERGDFTGERRDSIAYVCQRPGQFTIPAVKLTWFDLEVKQLKIIAFPGRTLDVAPNPAMASAAVGNAKPASDRGRERALWLGVLAVMLANGVAVLGWKTRGVWQPAIDLFRPVHLAPLNPTDQSHKH